MFRQVRVRILHHTQRQRMKNYEDQEPDNQEIQSTFKPREGALTGETWTASELFGPQGHVDGAHNNIFYRAKVAMQEREEQRLSQKRDTSKEPGESV